MTDTTDKYRRTEIIIIAATAVIALISTAISAVAIYLSNQATIHQSIYQIRRESAQSYSQAFATYDAVLHQIMQNQRFDIEEQAVVNAMTAQQLEELRGEVQPITAATRSFWASYRTNLTAWPIHVRDLMQEAARKGDDIAKCYESAATRALTGEEIIQVKHEINKNCRDLGTKHDVFETRAIAAQDDMIKEVYNAADALGSSPEHFSNDAIRRLPPTPSPVPFN